MPEQSLGTINLFYVQNLRLVALIALGERMAWGVEEERAMSMCGGLEWGCGEVMDW